jgi:hypothetical protein
MRSVEIVEGRPLPQAILEEAAIVDHDALQELVELVGVDPVRSLDLAVEARGRRPDVDMADARSSTW